MGKRLQDMITRYGPLAVVVYFLIFFLALIGARAAIEAGIDIESASAEGGAWLAAYAFVKVLQPIRIGLTFALVPPLAKCFPRFVRQQDAPEGEVDSSQA